MSASMGDSDRASGIVSRSTTGNACDHEIDPGIDLILPPEPSRLPAQPRRPDLACDSFFSVLTLLTDALGGGADCAFVRAECRAVFGE